jgi:hypothetical protein
MWNSPFYCTAETQEQAIDKAKYYLTRLSVNQPFTWDVGELKAEERSDGPDILAVL